MLSSFLAGGPVTVRGTQEQAVHPDDVLKGRHLIQTPFSEFGEPVTGKAAVKLKVVADC